MICGKTFWQMSRGSRQRLREEARQREKRLARRKKPLWFLPLMILIFVLVVVGAFTWILSRQKTHTSNRAELSQFHQPRTLKEMLALPPGHLENPMPFGGNSSPNLPLTPLQQSPKTAP